MDLLTITVLWLLTILITYGSDYSFYYIIIKDLAKMGYKISFNELKNIDNNCNQDFLIFNKIEHFIPIYNIVKSLILKNQFINNKNAIYEKLEQLGIIEGVEGFSKEDSIIDTIHKAYDKKEKKEQYFKNKKYIVLLRKMKDFSVISNKAIEKLNDNSDVLLNTQAKTIINVVFNYYEKNFYNHNINEISMDIINEYDEFLEYSINELKSIITQIDENDNDISQPLIFTDISEEKEDVKHYKNPKF